MSNLQIDCDYFLDCVELTSSGIIKSTNYPDNYENREEQCWLLKADEGQVQHFKV